MRHGREDLYAGPLKWTEISLAAGDFRLDAESEIMQTSLQTKGHLLPVPANFPVTELSLWKTHMDTLTSIFIVLATAVLWVVITSSMLALLGRAERRAGIREPRKKATGLRRRHVTGKPRKVRAVRRRTSRLITTHR